MNELNLGSGSLFMVYDKRYCYDAKAASVIYSNIDYKSCWKHCHLYGGSVVVLHLKLKERYFQIPISQSDFK